MITAQGFPTALVLLRLWDNPHSSTALRFASHRITLLFNLGFDVLDVAHRWQP